VFQGVLAAGASREGLRFAVVGAAGLGLIGALALACFTKVNGVVFLGQSRTVPGQHPALSDPRPNMLVPMLVLAVCCATIGLVPSLVLGPARLVAVSVYHPTDAAGAAYAEWGGAAARISALGFGLIALVGLTLLLRRLLPLRPRLGTTWACASVTLTPRAQYTASSYAAPLLAAFGPVAGVRRTAEPAAFHTHPVDLVQDVAVVPAWHALEWLSAQLRGIQGGRLRWYLLSVIFTLLALLYYLTIARLAP
jgi:hydrogenase-4 component B